MSVIFHVFNVGHFFSVQHFMSSVSDTYFQCNISFRFERVTRAFGCFVEVREWQKTKKSLPGKGKAKALSHSLLFKFFFLSFSIFPFDKEWVKICWARHLVSVSPNVIKESNKKFPINFAIKQVVKFVFLSCISFSFWSISNVTFLKITFY